VLLTQPTAVISPLERLIMPTTVPIALASVTDATFADEVLASPKPVLVDFTAAWCPGCRMIAPVLAQVAAEHEASLRVVTLDVDHNPQVPATYGVLAIPALVVFRDGEMVKSLVGARSKHRLLQELADVI
jgi:thioredoxin 1